MLTNLDDLIGAAASAHAQGRLDDADQIAREAWSAYPDSAEAALLLGIISVKRENPATAIPALTKALELEPGGFDAPFWLSIILRKIKRLPEALCMAEKAADVDPGNPQAQNQLGMCYLDLNEPEEAAKCFGKAATIAQTVAPFFDNLGRALQALCRHHEAVLAFRRALEIGPVTIPALFKLGDALMSIPDPQNAAHCAREMLKLDPNSANASMLLGRALIGDGQVAEGAEYAKRAMQLAPENGAPVAYYGRALQSLGEMEEANRQFEKSIELQPNQGFAYYALFHNRKVTKDDKPLIDQMERLTEEGILPKRELIQLEYALGKAYDNLGQYDRAMMHYDEANRLDHLLKVGVAPFDKKELERTADFLIQTFTPEFFEQQRHIANESELPIFVIGMMRSGTTLAEQILSSHPEVGGVGEQLFWPENAGHGEALFTRGALNGDHLQLLARHYLKLLEHLAPANKRVVDKMNTNYLLVGLLHLAYPNARFIHMKRNPVDTCLSIWQTPVAQGIDLCGKKENIVAAYRQYERVMAHWISVIPADRLLTVQYEELVTDQENLTREMIDFCGLEWNEACLKPEENKRSVKTPSVWQVRQPVYTSAVEKWRKYEQWLGAFSELV